MSLELYRTLKLSLPPDDFRRLPRNSAYHYELIAGEVWLTPRPRFYHALLDLDTFVAPAASEGVLLRPLRPEDWDALPQVFAAAFRTIPPFGSLDPDTRLDAAKKCLAQTHSGGDGPLLERACFVALEPARGQLCGAVLPTLIPLVDLSDSDSSARWEGLPPPDCVERRLGRPHLTWVFVEPTEAGEGVGTALLAAAVRQLLTMGFHDLATTFVAGNDQSMLWHWRNGFRLLAHPGSRRERKRRWK